jgi:hypothetical protein
MWVRCQFLKGLKVKGCMDPTTEQAFNKEVVHLEILRLMDNVIHRFLPKAKLRLKNGYNFYWSTIEI